MTRRCSKACTINGIYIPESMTVAIDCKSLHFDPEHWGADAHEFNPLRFSPDIKRHPAVYLPFGLGPRTCVGKRFGILAVKMTLAKLLSKYDVLKTADMPEELRFIETAGVMMPKDSLKVAFRRRSIFCASNSKVN